MTFTFKNVVTVLDAEALSKVEAPEIVTISPTLVYNKDASHAAAYADAVKTLQDGLVRVPVFGSRQFVELKPGESFVVDATHAAEIAFYQNLAKRYDDKKFIEAIVDGDDAIGVVAEAEAETDGE